MAKRAKAAKKKAAKKKAGKKTQRTARPAPGSKRAARAASRASETAAKHRQPRPAKLFETESEPNRAIERAAHDYVDIRDARMELTAKEVPAKQKLIDAMHKAAVKVYRRGNLEVVLTVEKEKIKVRLKDDSDTAGADGDATAEDVDTDVDVTTGGDGADGDGGDGSGDIEE